MSYKILYFPSFQSAEKYKENNSIDISVEMEYGSKTIEGSMITAAHHGENSHNPAPCVDERLIDLNIPEGKTVTVGVSHIDLDTILGVLHATNNPLKDIDGKPIDDKAFCEAAGYIDVNGSHNLHNVGKTEQDQLNAYWCWAQNVERLPRDIEYMDVTDRINDSKKIMEILLDPKHPEHDKMIQEGREWAEKSSQTIEKCLVFENPNVRAFVQRGDEGVYCAAAYYSPTMNDCSTSTITFNEKNHAITIAFRDGENVEGLNAKEIVQELWGPEAGGRKGIAGSPRGEVMSKDDFNKALDVLQDKIIERDLQQQKEMPKTDIQR